jgi:hypothetical protein
MQMIRNPLHGHFLSPISSQLAPAFVVIVLCANLMHASTDPQSGILPSAPPAPRIQITDGPAPESIKDNFAIIRWTSNNPGGSDEHFGIVHYGTDAEHLDMTAKSHIRLNQNHPTTVFRVRMDGLRPRTTYYYKVDSMQGNGKSDEVKSPLNHFATLDSGERIESSPEPAPQPK